MLMVKASEDPTGYVSGWAAVLVERVGRALTVEQVEHAAASMSRVPRFVMPYADQTDRFGPADGPAPTLAILEQDSPWNYGDLTQVDSVAILRDAADGAESPTPDTVLLPVADVVQKTREWLGPCDAHNIEAHFDRLVMDLGGARVEAPSRYRVPIFVLFGIA
jgi:hypothetical protein